MSEIRPAWVTGSARVFSCSYCGVRQGLRIHPNGSIGAIRGWHAIGGRLEFSEPKRGKLGEHFEPVGAELPAIAICRNVDCGETLKLDFPGFDRPI